MLVIVGTRTRERGCGYAADYCTVCRVPATMRITERRVIRTLYWIPISAGRPFEFTAACPRCASFFIRPLGHYRVFWPRAEAWESIADLTSPGLRPWIARKLEEDARIIENAADDSARLAMVVEVIASLEADAVRRQIKGAYESITSLIAMASILMASVAAAGWGLGSSWAWGATTASVLIGGVLFWRAVFGQAIKRARLVEIRVARAVAPFDPSESELREAIAVLRGHGSTIAQGMSVPRLMRYIEAEIKRAGMAGTSASD